MCHEVANISHNCTHIQGRADFKIGVALRIRWGARKFRWGAKEVYVEEMRCFLVILPTCNSGVVQFKNQVWC